MIREKDIMMMTIIIVGDHMITMIVKIVMIDLIGILLREIDMVVIEALQKGRGTEVPLEKVARNGGRRLSSGIENVIKGIFLQMMGIMQMETISFL